MRALLLPLAWLQALIWALALALPLQGAAAATLLGCAPEHSEPATPRTHQDESEAHHAHQHAEPAQKKTATHDGSQQCSACAACFVGAALPSAGLHLQQAIGRQVLQARPEPALLAVSNAALERPPRPLQS